MSVRVTVIIPSVGRPTLERALLSCEGADEILLGLNRDRDFGCRARNRLLARATGDIIGWMDDDDIYLPGAIEAIRAAATEHPGRILVFKMRFNHDWTIWHHRTVTHGNIGTLMLAIPNLPGRFGEWKEHRGAGSGGCDYEFLAGCVSLMGEPIWIDRVIAQVRPG